MLIVCGPPGAWLASMMAARKVQTPFGTPLLYAVAQMPSLTGAAPTTSDVLLTVKMAARAEAARKTPRNATAITTAEALFFLERCEKRIVRCPCALLVMWASSEKPDVRPLPPAPRQPPIRKGQYSSRFQDVKQFYLIEKRVSQRLLTSQAPIHYGSLILLEGSLICSHR